MSSSDLNEDEGVLKRQMIELENQIHHLTRSNAEMKEILETEGSDPDLRGAIGENIVAIARQLPSSTIHLLACRTGGVLYPTHATRARAVDTRAGCTMTTALPLPKVSTTTAASCPSHTHP